MEENNEFGQALASWNIPEFEKYQRTIVWYVVMIGSGLGLFIWAVWTMNFLFAIIIFIIATIIFIHERREPDMLEFTIYEDGILLDRKFFLYKEIKKFWIIYEPPIVKNLYFQVNRQLRSELSIPLINMNPVYIRKILLKYLEEDLEQKDFSTNDQMQKILKI